MFISLIIRSKSLTKNYFFFKFTISGTLLSKWFSSMAMIIEKKMAKYSDIAKKKKRKKINHKSLPF